LGKCQEKIKNKKNTVKHEAKVSKERQKGTSANVSTALHEAMCIIAK
jgi:hypothetical protein